MLGEGRSTRTAGKAVGVSGEAVRKWIKREEEAGRPVDIVPAPQGRARRAKPKESAAPVATPRTKGTPGLTPASVGGPAPPAEIIDFAAIEKMDLEEQLKLVAHLARTADRESDRMTAHKILADLRRKEAPPERDEGAVPTELVALWNRPAVRRLLERLVAAERGAA